MPDEVCEVAVIGGGIIGASLAYHLARKGVREVTVFEREASLGARSTAKAAGGIRAQFSSEINIELSRISLEHFERFSAEMEVSADFHQVGYLWLATTEEQMRLFRRNVERQRRHGLDVRLLTPEEVPAIAPYVRTEDLAGATFHQRDGYASPADFVQGYEKQARRLGVKFRLAAEVTGLLRKGTAVCGLRTRDGEIRARHVVCAAGAFSAKIGEMASVEIPVEPVRRQCFVTKPISSLKHPVPMTVDYTSGVYLHSESGGLLLGKADKDEPPSFNETVDYRFLELIAELALERVPALSEAEIRTGWAGLYEVTPDHHPILGPVPGVPGFWCAAGFSGHGVMHAPATGLLMAEWIVDGKPSLDLTPLRLSRFREHALVGESHVI